MDLRFANEDLKRLAEQQGYDGGFSKAVVAKFRERIRVIRAAKDERDFYALRSLRFEKLKGKRRHQRSMRINDQFRVIVEIKKGNPKNTAVIVSVEDYH